MNIKSRVTIIGAGASGLQCANELINKYGYNLDDIIIVEGRNRIGGRIYTTNEIRHVQTSTSTLTSTISTSTSSLIDDEHSNNNADMSTTVTFPMDHGAAWVHGLGVEWNTPIHINNDNDNDDNNNNSVNENDNVISSEIKDESYGDNKDTMDEKTIKNSNKPIAFLYKDIANPIPNPIIPILQQIESKVILPKTRTTTTTTTKTTLSSDDTTIVVEDDTVFKKIYNEQLYNTIPNGNPWMRPKYVLHETNLICVYKNGQVIINNSKEVTIAIQQHYSLLQKASNLGNDLFSHGLGMETVQLSLQDAFTLVTQNEEKEQQQSQQQHSISTSTTTTQSNTVQNEIIDYDVTVVESLIKLYQHLLECWYGTSISDLQLCEFVETAEEEEPNDVTANHHGNEHDATTNADNTNTNPWIHMGKYYTEEGDFYGPHCTMQNGMISIIQQLLKVNITSSTTTGTSSSSSLEDRILLNHEVIAIDRIHINDNNNTTITIHDDDRIVNNENDNKNVQQSQQEEKNDNDNNDNYNGVLVTCANGVTITTSDVCVVTIPAGCLKENYKTLFNTTTAGSNNNNSLSDDKIDAIIHTDMGSYKKIFLTFNTIFWPTHTPFLALLRTNNNTTTTTTTTTTTMADNDVINNNTTTNDCPIGDVLLIDNLWAERYNIPCLEAVLFGKYADWASDKSDEVISSVVVDFIYNSLGINNNSNNSNNIITTTTTETVSNNTDYNVIDCHITRWEEDKFSKGAYSAMMVGATPKHHIELNTPEWNNTLLFSGEVTISHYEGSVHAALFSGINSAQTINTIIQNKNKNKHTKIDKLIISTTRQ